MGFLHQFVARSSRCGNRGRDAIRGGMSTADAFKKLRRDVMAGGERTLVFVFGTLKEGFPNFAVNRGRRVGGVFRTLDRLPLLLVGERHVPWLIDSPGEGERVTGEVYEVDAAALAAMDELEGVGRPDGYHRKPIRVRAPGDGGAELVAQIYMKHAHQLDRSEVRQGPLAEYTPVHAALYRKRGEQAY